jgi:hypothetical protein
MCENENKCGRCDKNEESKYPHSCPYQRDVNGDTDDEHCNCCDVCEQECSDNI